jgi:adenylate kinase family enzyme
MKRILVVGSSGAGKTMFSLRLCQILAVEIIHIDREYWRPGWAEPTKEEWREKLAGLLSRDAWIMDGNYSATLEQRLAACDTVVFLDIRRTLCTWRVIRRTLRFYKRRRPDMADGCYERLDVKFLQFVWNYPERSKPKVISRINAYADSARLIHLRSPSEVERFLKALENERQPFAANA